MIPTRLSFERATGTRLSAGLSASASGGTLHRHGFRPRVPPWPRCTGGRPYFRSLEFSDSLRHSYHCPALTAQGRSPAGETGAYLTAHSGPASAGGPAETPGYTARGRPATSPQAAWLAHVHLPGSKAGQQRHARGWRTPQLILPRAASAARRARHGAMETASEGQSRVSK